MFRGRRTCTVHSAYYFVDTIYYVHCIGTNHRYNILYGFWIAKKYYRLLFQLTSCTITCRVSSMCYYYFTILFCNRMISAVQIKRVYSVRVIYTFLIGVLYYINVLRVLVYILYYSEGFRMSICFACLYFTLYFKLYIILYCYDLIYLYACWYSLLFKGDTTSSSNLAPAAMQSTK